MSAGDLDDARMAEALRLAQEAVGLSDPNPRVGCVIGNAAGQVFGTGFTREPGGPHAEAVALQKARTAGHSIQGATAWVTLEPCAHHGRTPPCCEALITAGIARVVVAIGDPFPEVSGKGIARLQEAGIQVDLAGDVHAKASRELNVGFFSRFERGRPWIRLKVACSIDGRTALQGRESRWITGVEARTDGHRWRKRASAVITGIGTVLADDPELTVRLVPTERQPLRVVLDSHLRTPLGARLLQAPGRTVIAFASAQPVPERRRALEVVGAELIELGGSDRQTRLLELVDWLAENKGCNELHVEAGELVNGAFLDAGLVDELLIYQAPVILGPGLGVAAMTALTRIDDGPRFRFAGSVQLGNDLLLRFQAP